MNASAAPGRASPAPLLAVEGLRVAYGGVEAVRGVSLDLAPGEVLAVLGANGAGKTTLLNALMGVLPSRGRAALGGLDLAGLPPERRVGLGLGLVPERRELFGAMSVEDNLRLGFFPRRREGGAAARAALAEAYALFPRLAERRRQTAATLSGGERQMLAMGRALMARPKLLMLDEPSLGLAPLIVRDVLATVAGLARGGVAVLLVEQNARAALAVADCGLVLEGGVVAISGPSAALAADSRVVDTYLGATSSP